MFRSLVSRIRGMVASVGLSSLMVTSTGFSVFQSVSIRWAGTVPSAAAGTVNVNLLMASDTSGAVVLKAKSAFEQPVA